MSGSRSWSIQGSARVPELGAKRCVRREDPDPGEESGADAQDKKPPPQHRGCWQTQTRHNAALVFTHPLLLLFSSPPVLLEVFAYVYFCLSIPWLLGVTSQNKQKSHPCFYRKWSPRCSDPLCHTAHVCRRMTLKLWLYAVFVPSLVLTSFSVFNMGGKGKQNSHKLPDKFLWKEYKLL